MLSNIPQPDQLSSEPDLTSTNLLARLRSFGQTDAVVFHGASYSYAALASLADEWRVVLDDHEVHPGEIVALEAAYSPHACAALLALIQRGVIVVPMSPAAPARHELYEVSGVERRLTVGSEGSDWSCERTSRTADHPLYDRLRAAGRSGLVLFSSGTSGAPKASVLDFERLLGRYGPPSRPRRTLAFLSLDHIGGINTLLHTLSQGGALVTVSERTPDSVFAAIAAEQVHVLPTTPTFLTMVLIAGAHQRYDISSLELITYGTEPMPAQTLRRLRDALPGIRLKQTYGLSELGILPTRSKSDDSPWVKIGGEGFAYRILNDVLWIRSEMAMLGYLNAEAPFDEDGYFNTQDAVEVDGDYVRILGRRSELINVAGEKVYPTEVESVLLEVPNVAEATVSGRRNAVTGMVVQAIVRLSAEEDERAVRRRVREHCTRRLAPFKVPAVVEVSTAPQHSDRFKKIRRP